jgi:molybdate transport system regulatory protein
MNSDISCAVGASIPEFSGHDDFERNTVSLVADTLRPDEQLISQVVIVRPRVYIGKSISLGPGKIDLLRKIGELHSISAAARALDMPYKSAWLLIDSLNQGFRRPVVAAASGGKGGGGAKITQLGLDLLDAYSALEERINSASTIELETLSRLVD